VEKIKHSFAPIWVMADGRRGGFHQPFPFSHKCSTYCPCDRCGEVRHLHRELKPIKPGLGSSKPRKSQQKSSHHRNTVRSTTTPTT
jgi:hypothetical protein